MNILIAPANADDEADFPLAIELVTPHLAFGSEEAPCRIRETTDRMVTSSLKGRIVRTIGP